MPPEAPLSSPRQLWESHVSGYIIGRFPDNEVAHVWILLRRLIYTSANATFVKNARDQAEVI
jgi:hypothetical protein